MTSPTPQPPRHNSLLQTLAEAYLERGQYAEAADKFSELVRNDLQTPNVYRNLALSLLGMQSLSAAAQPIYEYVLKIFPNDRELFIKICALLLKHKASDAFAFKCYQQTLALNPPPARGVLIGLAAHLQTVGYESAAFEILKRLALRENGAETQTLVQLTKLAARIDKQGEARNILLYLQGRNERAHGVARLLAHEYARTFLRSGDTTTLATREWQTITQAALEYERLPSLSAAREYVSLRLALARMYGRSTQSSRAQSSHNDIYLSDFLRKLVAVHGINANTNQSFRCVYGLRLNNLSRIRAEAGETVARDLAQKFLTFASKQLSKTAQAACYVLAEGFLASANSLAMLVEGAIDLLHKIERYNLTATKGTQLFVQTVVHTQNPTAASYESLQALYETLHLLEAQPLQAEMATEGRNCLWLPRAVYEEQLDAEALPASALGLVRFPEEEFEAEVYEAIWRNPLAYVDEKTPRAWGRFIVSAKLRNVGAVGTYLGRDRQLERNVIIRALSPALSAQLAQDSAQREHVLAAIRKLAKLEAPGIAAIYDMGFQEEIFFYAREYLEGQTLAEAQRNKREFSREESLKLGARMCRILSVAHRNGVVHGNLKPQNVWLFSNNELKLSDFYVPGFAEQLGPATDTRITPEHYSAPELYRTFAPNGQSDVYAVGVLLYELLSGNSFFPELEIALTGEEDANLPALSSLQSNIPPALDQIIFRACHRNPLERYQSMAELEIALRALLA